MKRDFLRRSLALAVAVSMTVSSFPGAAFAEEAVYEEIVADDAVEVADVGTDEIVADDAAVVAEEVAEAEVAETPLGLRHRLRMLQLRSRQLKRSARMRWLSCMQARDRAR